MEGHGEKFSREMESAIAALLTEPTIAAAAAKIGVGEVTLWRWMKQPEFRETYRQARREVLSHALMSLQQALSDAMDTLRAVMKDESASQGVRITAAKTVFDMAVRAVDLDNKETWNDTLQDAFK